MPINGLTHRGNQFPIVGVLRKGAEKPERGPGKDLEHFRLDTDHADVQSEFEAVYGKEPKTINVFLPFPTTDQNFVAWKELWVAGGLKRRCDGDTCALHQTADGRYSHAPIACVCSTLKNPRKEDVCKPTGRLQVIVKEMRRLAVFTVLTTSIHDVIELHSNLSAIEAMRGNLVGVPFILRRMPREISMPGEGGKRVRRKKWLLHIEADPAWVQFQFAAMEAAARPQLAAPAALALPAPSGASFDPSSGAYDDDYVYEDDGVIDVEADDAPAVAVVSDAPVATPATSNGNGKPATADEARQRFTAKYGAWAAAVKALKLPADTPEPTTIDAWVEYGKAMNEAAK